MRPFGPDSSRGGRRRLGFTLVELLVVITIIGILMALLLPAVNSAREAARAITCLNNVKQMSLAAITHENQKTWFPTGGWGWGWAGDPDRGFANNQPGGFFYNILPFMDNINLWQTGAGTTAQAKADAIGQILQIPMQSYNCPSRRDPILYKFVHAPPQYCNATNPTMIARGDYAANGGTGYPGYDPYGPSNLQEGDGWSALGIGPGSWNDPAKTDSQGMQLTPAVSMTGVNFLRSMVKMGAITDGASNTILVGERCIDPDLYNTGTSGGDDQGWDLGYDLDVNRWGDTPPMQDRPGVDSVVSFGSVHASGFGMGFCDGHTTRLSYGIDPTLFQNLCSIADGNLLDDSKY